MSISNQPFETLLSFKLEHFIQVSSLLVPLKNLVARTLSH